MKKRGQQETPRVSIEYEERTPLQLQELAEESQRRARLNGLFDMMELRRRYHTPFMTSKLMRQLNLKPSEKALRARSWLSSISVRDHLWKQRKNKRRYAISILPKHIGFGIWRFVEQKTCLGCPHACDLNNSNGKPCQSRKIVRSECGCYSTEYVFPDEDR